MHLAIIVDIAANGESGGAELLVIVCDLVAPCYWHVVDHPLLHVVFMNPLLKKLEFLSISLVVASVHVSFVAKNNGIFHILSESHLQREPTHEVHLHTAEGGRVTHIVGRGPDPLSKHNLGPGALTLGQITTLGVTNLAKILHRVPVCRVFIHFTEIKTVVLIRYYSLRGVQLVDVHKHTAPAWCSLCTFLFHFLFTEVGSGQAREIECLCP
jgi:hypothetical protein